MTTSIVETWTAELVGNRTRPLGGWWDSWYYIPPEPISEISVKLGKSAVAEFGFGLRLWGVSLEAGPSHGLGRSSRSKSQFDTLIFRFRRWLIVACGDSEHCRRKSDEPPGVDGSPLRLSPSNRPRKSVSR